MSGIVPGRPYLVTLGLDAVLVGAPKIVGGFAIIGLNLWAARQLTPSTYGVFAVGLTTLLLIDSVFGSALDLAALKAGPLQPRGGDGVTAVERAAVLSKLALAAAMVMFAIMAGRPLSLLVYGSDQRPAVILTAVAGGGLLLLRSVQVHLQLIRRFDLYGTADIAHTGGRVLLAGAIVAAGMATPASLLACYALAPLVVSAGFLGSGYRRASSAAWIDFPAWRELWRFTGVAIVTCGVGALVSRLDILILTSSGRAAEVGLFGVANTVALVPTLLGAYLSPIFAPRIAPLCRDGRFNAFYRSTQAALWIGGALLAAAGFLAAGVLIETILPIRYAGSAEIIRVLLPAGIAGFLIFPLTIHFLMFYAPRTFLALDALSLPALIPAYIWAARQHGALGVAWVTTVSTVLKAAVAQLIALRLATAIDRRAGAAEIRRPAASWFADIGAAVGRAE